MKRSRFTEEQIIGILREHEAGVKRPPRGGLSFCADHVAVRRSLMAQSGHSRLRNICPLLGVKRTSRGPVGLSAFDGGLN
jgi:hypothetical protein